MARQTFKAVGPLIALLLSATGQARAQGSFAEDFLRGIQLGTEQQMRERALALKEREQREREQKAGTATTRAETEAVAQALAQQFTGNTLLLSLQDEPVVRAFVYGFIRGVAELLGAVGHGESYCYPSAVVARQYFDVVEKWLKDNPEKRHKAAIVCVATALFEAFPCAVSEAPRASASPSPP